jgi:NifU-like protein involved in Fe-S cluster formation
MSGEMEMSSKNESRKTAYIEEVEEVHTQPVLDYLDRPRNIEIMRNFDGEGQATAQSNKWEATIWIYLKVREGKIWKATWFSTGIGELITAYGSALTEMVKGKTIREALWIRPEEISASLDLPETGFGVWVKGALLEAINNYNIYKSAPWTKIYEQKC